MAMNMYKHFHILKVASKFNYLQHVSRAIGFKVLNADLDFTENELHATQLKAKGFSRALETLSCFIKAGGGKKGIHRHTVVNKKMLARNRLKLLFDSDSPFLEIGLLAGMSMDYGSICAAGTIVGIGKIHGHFCIVGANDATVKGGTFFPITVTKQLRMQQLALLNRLPSLYLVDSGGAFLPLQSDIFADVVHGGRTFYNEAILSSLGIPQLALVCGSSTAGGAYCPNMAEEAVILKDSGVIFLGGPPLVKAATGEIVSEQDLGGADMHCSQSGCTDYYAESEEEAIELCRESMLTINFEIPAEKPFRAPLYSQDDLLLLCAKEKLLKSDMYVIISRLLDGSQFKEFKTKFGNNLITGFGYIHGILVGVLANCNSLSFQDAQKGAHFIQLCEKRNIPICFLQNSGHPEECVSSSDSSYDFLKFRSKMVAAHSIATVPKITLCVKSCYGDDNFTMCGWSFQPNFFFSWPFAHIASSAETAPKSKSLEETLKNLDEAKDVDAFDCLFDDSTSAFYHASRMTCDGIISPENSREVLSICLKITRSKHHTNKNNYT